MLRTCLILALSLLLILPAHAWGSVQKAIPLIETMPDSPQLLKVRDWRQTAKDYDQLIFDFAQEGPFLPLITWDENPFNFRQRSFHLPSYVGDFRMQPGSQEGINLMAAVVGASLVGIDKSDQHRENWVLMLKEFYNHANGLNLVLNHSQGSTSSLWYSVFPNMLFLMALDLYPELGDVETVLVDGGTLTMNEIARRSTETALKWVDTLPVAGEVDGAAGLAWLFYQSYLKWPDQELLEAATQCLLHLVKLDLNPFYEVLLPYGVTSAVRLNAEQDLHLDYDKLLQWCFAPSDVRKGWGVISDRWGHCDVHGLVGSQSDGGGYAFAMNTFQAAAALLPLLRYDPRYADALGKWSWQVINNARLFYPDELSPELQSSPEWLPFSRGAMAYEGLRRQENGYSPYATGDAVKQGWAATNYALYGSSHVGFLAGIFAGWDGEVLRLDLCQTDFAAPESYPTFLYYNPMDHETVVNTNSRIYDLVSKEFYHDGIPLKAQQGAVLVFLPADSQPTYRENSMLVGGVVVDYMVNMLAFAHPKEGEGVGGELICRLDLILQGENKVAEAMFRLDGEGIWRAECLPHSLSVDTTKFRDRSWHQLEVEVTLTNGVQLRDKVHFQVQHSILGRAKADDLANWTPRGAAVSQQNQTLTIRPQGERGMLLSPPFSLDFDIGFVLEINGILAKGPWQICLLIAEERYPLTELEARSGKFTVDTNRELPASLRGTHTAQLALVVEGEITVFRNGLTGSDPRGE
ncbi:MAG: hypothetical protein ACOX57_05065 [Limnochordia bacterium]